jgi:hypothetical protein
MGDRYVSTSHTGFHFTGYFRPIKINSVTVTVIMQRHVGILAQNTNSAAEERHLYDHAYPNLLFSASQRRQLTDKVH